MTDWLKPPKFEDETKTHRAFVLHVLLWVLICIPIPYAILTFILRNNGLGFDIREAEKLLGAFQRIVRRQDGQMWAESQPGQGATFHFT